MIMYRISGAMISVGQLAKPYISCSIMNAMGEKSYIYIFVDKIRGDSIEKLTYTIELILKMKMFGVMRRGRKIYDINTVDNGGTFCSHISSENPILKFSSPPY